MNESPVQMHQNVKQMSENNDQTSENVEQMSETKLTDVDSIFNISGEDAKYLDKNGVYVVTDSNIFISYSKCVKDIIKRRKYIHWSIFKYFSAYEINVFFIY